MPVASNALIQGYPSPGNGDRHVLVLDTNGCWLYELYNSHYSASGGWSADSTAIWDMTIDPQRPYTWTSADAAGLPIFPGPPRVRRSSLPQHRNARQERGLVLPAPRATSVG